MATFQSSNPVLNNQDAFKEFYGGMTAERPTTATIQGVVNKTAILLVIAVIAGGFGYQFVAQFPAMMLISCIAAFLIALGFCFVVVGKPHLAKIFGPIYAIVEGVFLGCFTALADRIVASQGLEVLGGVGLQAFVVTCAVFLATLGLYRAGVLRATPAFKKFIYIAMGGIFLAYVATFILGVVFGVSMPLISFASAVGDRGAMGLLGLGLNIAILGIAALSLVLDFDRIEQYVGSGMSKDYEWFGAFGLLVTLAWIYFEAVKLIVRLAVLFGGRD